VIGRRFTVGGVTGWKIRTDRNGEHGRSGSGSRRGEGPPTLWYVHDRLRGYAIVREFRGPYAHRLAERLAAKLNAEQAAA
jgi:hypothetical protein